MMDDRRIKGQLFRNHHITPKISFEGEGSDPDGTRALIFIERKNESQVAAAHPAAELRGMLRAAAMSIEF
jgi:hypothetical protein